MERALRMQLLVDVGAPLDAIEHELRAFRAWVGSELSIALIVYGERASWVVEPDAPLAGSAIVRGVRRASRPALGAALALVAGSNDPVDALVALVASEPAEGWVDEIARVRTPFRACVNVGGEPAAALGHGHLGALFRREHLGVALRWATRELVDRTWRCACGEVRVHPDDLAKPCPSCGAVPDVPPRLRVGDRVILLGKGARLYPHHVGAELAFDEPIAELDDLPRVDGSVTLGGITAEVRTSQPARTQARARDRFRPTALRALGDRCDACEGPLAPPVAHVAPDPRRFCAKCVADEARCDFCATPVGSRGGNAWPDGRKACRDCWTTATTSASDLASLAALARAWMKRRLGMELPDCPIHFEHASAIARMHGRTFTPIRAFNARPIGFFRKPLDEPAAIFVEHGLPRSIAYGVLAHELTHLWQWHNWQRDRALTLVEGLAMWVEYQALLDAGAIHAARDAERYGDPVYGLGFRVALAVEKDVGFDRVKEQMQHVAALRA